MSKKDEVAKQISQLLPTFLRHMFPYVFEGFNVPPSQVLALVSIQERGTCTLGQLKDEMHVSAPTITGIIDRLERDGYVKRQQDEIDRRVTNVTVTPKGLGITQQLRNNIQKRWSYILEKTPLEPVEAVVQTMEGIVKRFNDGTL